MFGQNLKRGLLTAAAGVAVIAGLGVGPANAVPVIPTGKTIAFDPNGTAADSGTAAIRLMNIWDVKASTNYAINVDLGGDSTLSNGDTFFETFRMWIYQTEKTNPPFGSSTTNPIPQGTSGVDTIGSMDYVDFALQGTITGCNAGCANVTYATPDFSTAVFNINFANTSTANWYYDPGMDQGQGPTGDANLAGPVTPSQLIAAMTLASGGATGFSFNNSLGTSSIGLTFDMAALTAGFFFDCPTQTPANPAACTTDLTSFLHLETALANGSVNSINVTQGVSPIIILSTQDNGSTLRLATTVPEPSTLLVFGSALLLGGGFMRRRGKAA